LSGVSSRAGADQLAALLTPDTAVADVDPRRPSPRVVARPAHDGGIAVGRQTYGGALLGASNSAGADQLAALLVPNTAVADVDPRRPSVRVVLEPAHYGGIAVGRHRHGEALFGASDDAGAD
jgi:hypothetical protein